MSASKAAETRDGNWTLVVAMSRQGVIGRQGELPWRLRSDLQRFKRLTMGHCLLMGRKTYDSIGRPLPGRQTIVLSRSPLPQLPAGVTAASDLAKVDSLVEPGRHVMVVGGAQIYAAALPRCQRIWRTLVLADVAGDVCFPEMDWERWELVQREQISAGPNDAWPTEFQDWQRK